MKIEHCAIWVRDIERTRQFFGTFFHTKASDRYDNDKGFSSYFLSFADSDTRIEIMQSPDVPIEIIPATSHIAISVGTKESVDELTRQLAADGHKLLNGPRVTGDGYYESCLCIFGEFILELTV